MNDSITDIYPTRTSPPAVQIGDVMRWTTDYGDHRLYVVAADNSEAYLAALQGSADRAGRVQLSHSVKLTRDQWWELVGRSGKRGGSWHRVDRIPMEDLA